MKKPKTTQLANTEMYVLQAGMSSRLAPESNNVRLLINNESIFMLHLNDLEGNERDLFVTRSLIQPKNRRPNVFVIPRIDSAIAALFESVGPSPSKGLEDKINKLREWLATGSLKGMHAL